MSKTVEEINELVADLILKDTDVIPKAPTKEKPKEKPADFVDTTSSVGWVAEANTTIIKYSELFGWDDDALAGMDDYDVVTYDNDYWTEDDRLHIPDASKFEHRVVDHEVMYFFVKIMQPEFMGSKPMLVGPTGSGKTSMVEFYCSKINQPFLRINGRQDMESDSLIGRPTIEAGTMGYKLGEWPKASKKGWLVLFDEPWKTPPGIMMTIQPHLERGGIWYIEDMPGEAVDKQIVPKSSYRCVLADNVVGTGDNVEQYAATMIQDGSSLNRVDYVIRVPYLKADLEVEIMQKQFPQIAEGTAKRMINMLNLLRDGYDSNELSSPASLRNIEAWTRAAIAFKSINMGFKHTLLNRYADDSEAAAVRKHYHTCFGENV